jgi:hypothetical protein
VPGGCRHGNHAPKTALSSQRVQVRPADRQVSDPRFPPDGEGLRHVGIDQEAVTEMVVNEFLCHLIEEQIVLANFTLPIGREDRHDEAVAYVDVESVS